MNNTLVLPIHYESISLTEKKDIFGGAVVIRQMNS